MQYVAVCVSGPCCRLLVLLQWLMISRLQFFWQQCHRKPFCMSLQHQQQPAECTAVRNSLLSVAGLWVTRAQGHNLGMCVLLMLHNVPIQQVTKRILPSVINSLCAPCVADLLNLVQLPSFLLGLCEYLIFLNNWSYIVLSDIGFDIYFSI